MITYLRYRYKIISEIGSGFWKPHSHPKFWGKYLPPRECTISKREDFAWQLAINIAGACIIWSKRHHGGRQTLHWYQRHPSRSQESELPFHHFRHRYVPPPSLWLSSVRPLPEPRVFSLQEKLPRRKTVIAYDLVGSRTRRDPLTCQCGTNSESSFNREILSSFVEGKYSDVVQILIL